MDYKRPYLKQKLKNKNEKMNTWSIANDTALQSFEAFGTMDRLAESIGWGLAWAPLPDPSRSEEPE